MSQKAIRSIKLTETLTLSEERYTNLSGKVEKFISQFVTEDEFEID